jgi:hypothetical protein
MRRLLKTRDAASEVAVMKLLRGVDGAGEKAAAERAVSDEPNA